MTYTADYWSDRLRRLETLGLADLVDWYSDPPVQFVGRIMPEGNGFYLRLRSGGGSLDIYEDRHDNSPAIWCGVVDYDEGPDPCVFDAGVVADVAARLLTEWRGGVPSVALP